MYGPFVGEGDLVFDVGAHLGDRTAAFHALGARVIALEPQPSLADWLERLVGRLEGVTVLRAAAGAAPGSATLAVASLHPTVSTLAHGWRRRMTDENPGFRRVRWDEEVEVDVTTLDRLVSEYGVPSFLKIDVEGFEADVLAGLSVPVPALSVEFVAGGLDVAVRCIDRLAALAPYEFNVVPGERRDRLWPEWRDGGWTKTWLNDGADGIPSGDLYARRTGSTDEAGGR
jgi:FkbM family methyltransferase